MESSISPNTYHQAGASPFGFFEVEFCFPSGSMISTIADPQTVEDLPAAIEEMEAIARGLQATRIAAVEYIGHLRTALAKAEAAA